MAYEEDKNYSFMIGNRDVMAKVVAQDDESITLEYAMTVVSAGQNAIAPMPLDKFGDQKLFKIHIWAIFGEWELMGKSKELYENYHKERKAAESGLVFSASMADVHKAKAPLR
jgi:hypothetical protein